MDLVVANPRDGIKEGIVRLYRHDSRRVSRLQPFACCYECSPGAAAWEEPFSRLYYACGNEYTSTRGW